MSAFSDCSINHAAPKSESLDKQRESCGPVIRQVTGWQDMLWYRFCRNLSVKLDHTTGWPFEQSMNETYMRKRCSGSLLCLHPETAGCKLFGVETGLQTERRLCGQEGGYGTAEKMALVPHIVFIAFW